ncbi:hypothetical protein [Gaoshiqia sediminis]|uniref:GIY-YIG homing endonuclease n=1 Tax=Gaoshiqia sediminis TaxID=2986998 RepID=A0AA41YDK8_9BACT|nr:hypothetical protein [Gaoshiqia sediminis]MCW0484868.1 hypothetical protein [Gaoshiqia sediminis]
MYYSYVVYNLEHHRFHYGVCADIAKTEEAHNEGLIEETKGISPWNMVFHEAHPSKQHAIRRVIFYRTVGGQRFLKRQLHY